MKRVLCCLIMGAFLLLAGCHGQLESHPCRPLTDEDLRRLAASGPSDRQPGVPMLEPFLALQGPGVVVLSTDRPQTGEVACRAPVPARLVVPLLATPGSSACGDERRLAAVVVADPGCGVEVDGIESSACEWAWWGDFGHFAFTLGGRRFRVSVGVDLESDALRIESGVISDELSPDGLRPIGVWYVGSLPERCQAPDSRCCEPPPLPPPPRPDGGA